MDSQPKSSRCRSAGGCSVADLVDSLGPSLNTTSDSVRTRGSLLLGEALFSARSSITSPRDVHLYAEFLSSRLRDRVCLEGTLIGIHALGE